MHRAFRRAAIRRRNLVAQTLLRKPCCLRIRRHPAHDETHNQVAVMNAGLPNTKAPIGGNIGFAGLMAICIENDEISIKIDEFCI